jgi:predicted AAA+ superfamily ATPase
MMVHRRAQSTIIGTLQRFPAVAVVGPRQVGKTTLAKAIAAEFPHSIHLDLERPADLAKLADAELFLARLADRLVVLDEVQRLPEVFAVLRVLVDQDRRPGRFLLLGSASPALLRQASESLAGRVSFHELGPFDLAEIRPQGEGLVRFWERGGYPLSWLASSDADSFEWREAFIQTHLERDLPTLGIRVPGLHLRRFWQMLAHSHGQLWNASRLASSFGVSAPTMQHYLEILESTYMVRRLLPLTANLGKRLTKSPKVYIQDSGLLHCLLGIRSVDELYGHPVAGASWEGWVLEQLVRVLGPAWQLSFYRTAAGAEVDVVAERGSRRLAFEMKLSTAPAPTKGFWHALDDVKPEATYVVAPVDTEYPLAETVQVISPALMVERLLPLAC